MKLIEISKSGEFTNEIILDDFLREVVEATVSHYERIGFAQALGSSTHWLFAALLTFVFPQMTEAFSPAAIFGFFCGMMVLQLIWVKLYLPETKGVPLEEMPAQPGIVEEQEP